MTSYEVVALAAVEPHGQPACEGDAQEEHTSVNSDSGVAQELGPGLGLSDSRSGSAIVKGLRPSLDQPGGREEGVLCE